MNYSRRRPLTKERIRHLVVHVTEYSREEKRLCIKSAFKSLLNTSYSEPIIQRSSQLLSISHPTTPVNLLSSYSGSTSLIVGSQTNTSVSSLSGLGRGIGIARPNQLTGASIGVHSQGVSGCNPPAGTASVSATASGGQKALEWTQVFVGLPPKFPRTERPPSPPPESQGLIISI